jgi:hypothetical protein
MTFTLTPRQAKLVAFFIELAEEYYSEFEEDDEDNRKYFAGTVLTENELDFLLDTEIPQLRQVFQKL